MAVLSSTFSNSMMSSHFWSLVSSPRLTRLSKKYCTKIVSQNFWQREHSSFRDAQRLIRHGEPSTTAIAPCSLSMAVTLFVSQHEQNDRQHDDIFYTMLVIIHEPSHYMHYHLTSLTINMLQHKLKLSFANFSKVSSRLNHYLHFIL